MSRRRNHLRRLRRCRAHERFWITTGHWSTAASCARQRVKDDQGYGLGVMRRDMSPVISGWRWQRRSWWLWWLWPSRPKDSLRADRHIVC
jgi:hypothetical protein